MNEAIHTSRIIERSTIQPAHALHNRQQNIDRFFCSSQFGSILIGKKWWKHYLIQFKTEMESLVSKTSILIVATTILSPKWKGTSVANNGPQTNNSYRLTNHPFGRARHISINSILMNLSCLFNGFGKHQAKMSGTRYTPFINITAVKQACTSLIVMDWHPRPKAHSMGQGESTNRTIRPLTSPW